jgi:hypothetical protein
MAKDMANNALVVTALLPATLPGSTRLDPAIHHLKKVLVKIDGYAGRHRLRRRFASFARV